MAYCLSIGAMSCYRGSNFSSPSASLSLSAGSTLRIPLSGNMKCSATATSGTLLHCSLFPSSSLSSSSRSFFSGSSLGISFTSSISIRSGKRRGLVVHAKKFTLCQTKRHRSRKSLARTHGFRKRMSTTSGRAVIKSRRAKGRWVLCTKTNPSSGKRA